MKSALPVFETANELMAHMKSGIFLNTRANGVDNTMIIGWGGITFLWGRPMMLVLVRDNRATYPLLEASQVFTLSVPSGVDMTRQIRICGTKSGRDIDKFSVCELQKGQADKVDAPIVLNCPLHYECVIQYQQRLDSDALPELVQNTYYAPGNGHLHTLFFADIVAAYRTDAI
ncbi:MAG: flavin reductase family protein [Bacillus subtilis]|nr:flavin reductase family protein [Bacillus subtilis]